MAAPVDPKSFEPISFNQVPHDKDGNCTANLYVYLPTPKKFIVFVPKGEKFTYSRRAALEKHIIPALFIRTDGAPNTVLETGKPELDDTFEILGHGTSVALAEIFNRLSLESATPPQEAIAKLEKLADDIIKVVAPDMTNLKSKMLQNSQYLWVMNDAAALTTITIMFAAANEVISNQPLRDLACACLVMDLPLVKMSEEHIFAYLNNPDSLPPEIRQEYENHPINAHALATKQLKHFSEATFQLILNHHELYNGTGFPRKVRTSTLFPLLRVFSAAVNVFDILKRANHSGKPLTLQQAIAQLAEPTVDVHNRRHSKEIIDKVIVFMSHEGKH